MSLPADDENLAIVFKKLFFEITVHNYSTYLPERALIDQRNISLQPLHT
jgi:hypothetical protein